MRRLLSIGLLFFLSQMLLFATPIYQETDRVDPQSNLKIGMMQLNGQPVEVEIADTDQSQQYGLMNRLMLPKNRGMLFVFDSVAYRSFWMKNTKIPLDIIYIMENGEIANIVQAEPCLADPCPSYPSRQKVLYVLELAKGESGRIGVEIGDKVEWAE